MSTDIFTLLASFIPPSSRVEFLEIVIEACGRSISKTCKEIGIARSQVYRYLGHASRRDTPSDEVMAKILKASFKLRPVSVREHLSSLQYRFSELVSML